MLPTSPHTLLARAPLSHAQRTFARELPGRILVIPWAANCEMGGDGDAGSMQKNQSPNFCGVAHCRFTALHIDRTTVRRPSALLDCHSLACFLRTFAGYLARHVLEVSSGAIYAQQFWYTLKMQECASPKHGRMLNLVFTEP